MALNVVILRAGKDMAQDLCLNCNTNKAAYGNSFCSACQEEYERYQNAEKGLNVIIKNREGDLIVDMAFFPPKRQKKIGHM